jgi:hypothetical protein
MYFRACPIAHSCVGVFAVSKIDRLLWGGGLTPSLSAPGSATPVQPDPHWCGLRTRLFEMTRGCHAEFIGSYSECREVYRHL